MQEQVKKIIKDLVGSKEWKVQAITGGIFLAGTAFPSLLFLLALICFGRALYLAWPILKERYVK